MGLDTQHTAEEPVDLYQRLSSSFLVEADALPSDDERRFARKSIETMNTPLYAAVAEFETESEDVSRSVHTRVLNEGMYILYLDRAYERKDQSSLMQAESQHTKILDALTPDQRNQLLALEKKLFEFWTVEQDMRKRMEEGGHVSEPELREFIMRKSSDVFLYATITRFAVPLPRDVVLEFYVHQLLRDLEDDFRDLGEDAEEQMPNPLLLRLWQKGAFRFGQSVDQKTLEALTAETGVFPEHASFVRNYCQSLSSKLPEKYHWMRLCAGMEDGGRSQT